MTAPFKDRRDAGRRLAQKLIHHAGRSNVILLALPRGGVPVAFEVAKALRVPMDLFLVRRLGVPGREELAMDAIASGGVRILNNEVVDGLHISREVIERVTQKEQRELTRREELYRDNRPQPPVKGLSTSGVYKNKGTSDIIILIINASIQRRDSFSMGMEHHRSGISSYRYFKQNEGWHGNG